MSRPETVMGFGGRCEHPWDWSVECWRVLWGLRRPGLECERSVEMGEPFKNCERSNMVHFAF